MTTRLQVALAVARDLLQNLSMPKAKKRGERVVTYIRMKPEEHALIAQIAVKRGYPHTIASVAAAIISRGLKAEAKAAGVERQP